MIRLVIAEDRTLVRMAMAKVLAITEDIAVVGLAPTAREAIDVVKVTDADAVLMDLHLADSDGTAAVRTIAHELGCRVIVIAGSDAGTRGEMALAAGAPALVPRSAPPRAVVDAVRGGISRTSALSGPTSGRSDSPAPMRPAKLTEGDWAVLSLLAQGHSNREIASRLTLRPTTVKTHLSRIYRILEVPGRTQAALWAHERGLDRALT